LHACRSTLEDPRVENPVDHPMIRPSVNACAMTYRLAEIPEYQDLMTATSALTGRKVNRFVHLHQSPEDLVKKVKMQRLLGQMTGTCFQRCVGLDALNAVWNTTYEIDQKHGTSYHPRFRRFVLEWEERDWTVDGAMTDPKGNRALGPSAQADPDLYVRVVERRADGIVIRGAKVHQTGLLNSHQILVMPTLALKPEDADYAVCFAVPADDPTLIYIYGRQSSDTRKLERSPVDMGNIHYGGQEGVIISSTTPSSPGSGSLCAGRRSLPGCWWNGSPRTTGSPMGAAKWATATSSSARRRPSRSTRGWPARATSGRN
jgi:vinylacetyl-CoA delta-isomerase (EC 5.3.3.3)/4-hydroxybutyryl-CoA dehydratase (EC 4.2.1.-)